MRTWVPLVGLAVGCAPAPGERSPDDVVLETVPWAEVEEYDLDAPEPPHPSPIVVEVSIRPHPEHPLLALVEVAADFPCALEVVIDGPGVTARTEGPTELAPVHRHVVAGLRQDSDYRVHARVTDGLGRSHDTVAIIHTGTYPYRLPEIALTVPGDPDGILLTGVSLPGSLGAKALYLAVDAEAELVWYYLDEGTPAGTALIRRHDDGTFLVNYLAETRIIDVEGTTLARYADQRGDGQWHHDRVLLPDRHLLVQAAEHRAVEGPRGTVDLVGDLVLELGTDGREVRRWSAVDSLDPLRFPGPLSQGWWGAGLDWSHGNALEPTPDGEGWLVSLRHQHWIVRVDRDSTEVDWVLGPEGDFALLEGTWFDAQHNPVFVGDDELLVYDNGAERYRAGGPGSRVVRYELDQAERTVRELWAWPLPVHTPIVGGVQQWGDQILVTAGGREDGTASIYLVDEAGGVDWSLDVDRMVFRSQLIQDL